MKICLIGEYSEILDEGMKNIMHNIAVLLKPNHDVLMLSGWDAFKIKFWRNLRNFKPDIVHYVAGPSLNTLILLKLIKLFFKCKIILSAVHPQQSSFLQVARFFKPDIVLVQSQETDKLFKLLGFNTGFLANGVNTEKFVLVSSQEKSKLKKKYEISKEKFVVLHVGHLIKVRNLKIFEKIQNENNQVVIVASRHFKQDQKLYNSLRKKGCIIINEYLPYIEEVYRMSDCYVFPVLKGESIQTPLSVLEAMSCNLPVITQRFDGLAEIFNEDDYFIFTEDEWDFVNHLEKIKGNIVKGIEIKNRDKVMDYSWNNIVKELEKIYAEI